MNLCFVIYVQDLLKMYLTICDDPCFLFTPFGSLELEVGTGARHAFKAPEGFGSSKNSSGSGFSDGAVFLVELEPF